MRTSTLSRSWSTPAPVLQENLRAKPSRSLGTVPFLLLFMLIVLMPHMTYFFTYLHFMAVPVVNKINFWKLGNLCM